MLNGTIFLCILAMIAVQSVFVLLFSPFPTADASAHLASAQAMIGYLQGSEWERSMLEWNMWPMPPNLLPGLVLAALVYVLGAPLAEYAMIIGYLTALPLATLWVIGKIRPDYGWYSWLTLIVVALSMSHALLFGFFNFVWSLVPLVIFVGLVMSMQELTWKHACELGGVLFVLYCTHLVGWFAACVVLASVSAVEYVMSRDLKRLLMAATACAPTSALAALFLVESKSGSRDTLLNPLAKFLRIGLLEYGQSAYARMESVVFAALGLLVWVLLIIGYRRRTSLNNPKLLGLIGATLILWFIAAVGPEGAASGAAFLPQRLASIVALFAVILVTFGLLKEYETFIAGVFAGFVVLVIGNLRFQPLQEASRYQRALLELSEYVEPGSTILQANLAIPDIGDAARVRLFTGDSGRLAVASGGYELANVDLSLAYWPLRFKPATSPRAQLVQQGHDIEDMPPPIKIDSYAVDYVLLAGRSHAGADVLGTRSWRMFNDQLQRRFELVESSGGGYWELWASKPSEEAVAHGTTGTTTKPQDAQAEDQSSAAP